ncbi:MAG: exodeoxyribonuclease V subunit gamma [Desulfobacterales bacterium]
MQGFNLFNSNRLEKLLEILAQLLETSISSPLAPELFVVQSQGMSRWISLGISRYMGISANLKFFYPNDFMRFLFNQVMPDVPDSPLNDSETLAWKVMKQLPGFHAQKGFEKIDQYLENDLDEIKKYQLAGRIADLFDQYLLFRPEMILKWEHGEENHWQAELWRVLSENGQISHRAGLLKKFQTIFADLQKAPLDFPERVSVFGISALPRFHMELFETISKLTTVNLFLMNPCREYWGDIVSNREIQKRTQNKTTSGIPLDFLHLEQGNALLAALGTMGRDFFEMVNGFTCELVELFENPGENMLIQHIQSDILNLKGKPENANQKILISENDRSITIHSCHSPMRELEILHDHLLDLFEKNESLTPADILVMAPDIEAYSPYIRAVFDLPKEDNRWMPYSIADRSMMNESVIIQTFFAILDLSAGRYRVTDIIPIIESSVVRAKFELTESGLQLIQQWILGTRIKWGIDATHREMMGLPGIHENSWEAGIERLLLGYAMAGREKNEFSGILPYDLIEGNSALVAGKFVALVKQLFSFVRSLKTPRRLEEWKAVFENLLDSFFLLDEEGEREIQTFRQVLNDLETKGRDASFDQKVSIEVMKNHLAAVLKKKGFGSGFISGGITFSTMLPMRSIPFDVICLLGMNHDAYPRQTRSVEFDLISQNPKPGDRSRRHDDQYLFLESILSVRKVLYISYVGKSIRDNSQMPPSVLVSELIQYIEQGYTSKAGSLPEQIVIEHKLQPFNPAYFNASVHGRETDRFFSYSGEDLKGARCIQGRRSNPEPFFTKSLPEPEEALKKIDLSDLQRFLLNPSKYLLNKRLGLFLGAGEKRMDDREPFELDNLDRFVLTHDLVEQNLYGKDAKQSLGMLRSAGVLPHGNVGDSVFNHIHDNTKIFSEKLKRLLHDELPELIDFNLEISGVILKGKIDSVYGRTAVWYRYGAIRPKDLLKAWVTHLVLNELRTDRYPVTTIFAGLDEKSSKEAIWKAVAFSPVDNSRKFLEQILLKYREGLQKPLKFFPKTSHKFARILTGQKISPEEAVDKARSVFTGNDFSNGEFDDPYFRICFENSSPLDQEFQDNALMIWVPLLEHMKSHEG